MPLVTYDDGYEAVTFLGVTKTVPDIVHTRRIYFFGDYVVKVGSTGQNLAEATFWRVLSEEDRKYFAEVIDVAPQGDWLLQRKVELIGTHDRKVWRKVESLIKRYSLPDVEWCWNWGIRPDGTPVIYDMGGYNAPWSRKRTG